MPNCVRLSPASSPSTHHHCNIQVNLYDNQKLQLSVDIRSKFQEIFNQVCTHLGLRESEYFGLACLIDGEYRFLDLNTKIQKQIPRNFKSQANKNALELYFRVQFYVEDVLVLRERTTRHLYYLQLRQNLLSYNQHVSEEQCFLVAALALQADNGDFNERKHHNHYFDAREYFPAWVVDKWGEDYISRNLPAFHRDLYGLSRTEAETRVIRDVSTSPAAHNLHFYQLKKRKTDIVPTAWLAICTFGLQIYEESPYKWKDLLSTFPWSTIEKLSFQKKKFGIKMQGAPEGRKFTYFASSEDESKYLLNLSQITHQFQLTMTHKVAELHRFSREGSVHFREAIVSSGHQRSGYRRQQSQSPNKASTMAQRISVISSASSNTTSGIVSDRLHISFDDSEGDCQDGFIRDNDVGLISSFSKKKSKLTPSTSVKGQAADWCERQSLPSVQQVSPSSLNRVPSHGSGYAASIHSLPKTPSSSHHGFPSRPLMGIGALNSAQQMPASVNKMSPSKMSVPMAATTASSYPVESSILQVCREPAEPLNRQPPVMALHEPLATFIPVSQQAVGVLNVPILSASETMQPSIQQQQYMAYNAGLMSHQVEPVYSHQQQQQQQQQQQMQHQAQINMMPLGYEHAESLQMMDDNAAPIYQNVNVAPLLHPQQYPGLHSGATTGALPEYNMENLTNFSFVPAQQSVGLLPATMTSHNYNAHLNPGMPYSASTIAPQANPYSADNDIISRQTNMNILDNEQTLHLAAPHDCIMPNQLLPQQFTVIDSNRVAEINKTPTNERKSKPLNMAALEIPTVIIQEVASSSQESSLPENSTLSSTHEGSSEAASSAKTVSLLDKPAGQDTNTKAKAKEAVKPEAVAVTDSTKLHASSVTLDSAYQSQSQLNNEAAAPVLSSGHTSTDDEGNTVSGSKSTSSSADVKPGKSYEREKVKKEIEEIRGMTKNMSLPLIQALCNDVSLLQVQSSNPLSSAASSAESDSKLYTESSHLASAGASDLCDSDKLYSISCPSYDTFRFADTASRRFSLHSNA